MTISCRSVLAAAVERAAMIDAGGCKATPHGLTTVHARGEAAAKDSGAETIDRMQDEPDEDDCFGGMTQRGWPGLAPVMTLKGAGRRRP